MAHHNKFLSVNLNKSYGKPSSSSSGYGNVRPRSAGGSGGMVVLSRPRSSSGAAAHKSASKLAVPPPVNLPSLRKEHERLDPASSKPSSGHSGSGLGPGNGLSMGWTKPGLSSGEQQSVAGDARPQVVTEKVVILKGEDFPSLLATSASFSKQKQRQIMEKSDGWEEKTELSSVLDMRPQLKSSALIKHNVHGSDDRSIRIPYSVGQSRLEDANFQAPLPLVRLRHTSDWDDDERDRSHGVSASDDHDGRLLIDCEAQSLFSRDSGRGDLHKREFTNPKKVDRDVNSWRVTVQLNRDFSTPHELHVDRDLVGYRNSSLSRRTSQESSHAGLFNGDKRVDFGSVMGSGNVEVAENFNDSAEVSINWQRGKPFSSGMISKGPASSVVRSFPSKDPVLKISKEKVTSNAGKSYVEGVKWGGKGSLSSDVMLDLNAKVFRKSKEAMKPSDFFDPVRESFEAELEKVQQLQELERKRVMEEQARAMEVARREIEERERRVREEEERRRLIEEEAREATRQAERERLEAARRTEEQKIAIKEEKKRILMEEERRKEAAWQKLLELEARIAKRQTVANTTDDRMKERDLSRDSANAEWVKTERMVEPFTSSALSDSSFMNRLPETGFRTHSSNVGNHSFAQSGRPESNWSQNNNSNFKFQDQECGYPSPRHDAFCSKRGLHREQFQLSHAPMPLASSFKKGMSANQTETGQGWDRNNDCDQFNGSSNIDSTFGAWDNDHFTGSQLASYSQTSFQNTEVEDLVSFSRSRHTLRKLRVPPPPSLSSSWLKNSFGAKSEGSNSSLSVNSDARSNLTGSKEESDLQIVYNCRYQQIIHEPGTTELLEGTASSLFQTDDKSSPRYYSQSSLSISSPPSSPAQHSHDELDDCRGSPALTTSVEEENITISDSKPMVPELDARHVDSEITLFSHEEDDDWAVDNNEEIQEGDHDEVHDIFQEDNEYHDCDAGNLQMANKLDYVDAVVEKPDEAMRNSSFGIIVCPQLGASVHDVLNKDYGHVEKISINEGSPTITSTELVFANNSADMLQSKDAFTDEAINACSEEKSDKRREDVIFGPITTADHPPDSIETSKRLEQNPMESATSLSLGSSFCSFSASIPTSMDELPVRFQFGLFSGPPLIPSPLPTIQIGSIQMPLPLHEQFDPYGQMHNSHPPLFQFDQITRYTPPISQSALPIAAQTLPFMHLSALGQSHINQSPGSSSSRVIQDSTPIKILEKEQPSFPADSQPGFASEIASQCLENSDSEQLAALLEEPRDKVLKSQSQVTSAASDEKKDVRDLFSPSGKLDIASNKNYRSMVNFRHVRAHVESLSSNRKSEVVWNAAGTMPEIRGNRFSYNARNTGSQPSLRRTENLFVNSHGHQRRGRRHFQGTEYRVKENDGARQMHCPEIFNHSRQNEKPNYSNIAVGVSSRNSGRKDPVITKSTKLTDEEAASGTQVVGADSNVSRANKKETVPKMGMITGNFCGGEGILKKNGFLEDDVDAPLRSGIVRIFNQPGIEASADGDGFVEVRSKRKVSNERRGQRERETNTKFKVVKVPRRSRPTVLNNTITSGSDMVATLVGGAAAKGDHSNSFIAIRRPQTAREASLLPIKGMEGKTISPIHIPAMNFDDFEANFKSLNSSHVGSASDKASDGAKLMPSLSFGNNIIANDKASVPLGTWGTVHLNHQVITSTISHLDEATNPVESNPSAAEKISLDDSNHAASTMTHEKPYFSSGNQFDFPFAGEKIQFGAVALPPTLPSSSHSVSSVLWPSGSVILNPSIIHNVPVNGNSRSSFFDKEKCSGVPCTHLEDTEAEAEAAASAIAVAAISNDEISVCTLGTGSTSDNVTNGLNAPGVTRFVDVAGQSASEGSLVVTLPADLSVDTPHSLWPPLPSIQCSRPMLSHIAGPQPSSFPFFDPNPILGGPIFPFRSQDESTGPQAQPQQNATFGSVPTGIWSHCHSGVESFYGSPAGFPAPFMSPPAGLSGVHSQMVFYNHFAPVGQFGQVGLSYMGAAYIPTGKQPHNSEAPTVNVNKADPSNLNVVYGQQKVAHVPNPAQHLSSGTAVNAVNSPFTMFNLRPFQSSTETSIPGHWPPIPHPHLHSLRLLSAPEQLQSLPLDVSATNIGSNVPHSAAADLPDELGLLESTASTSANPQTIPPSRKPVATNSVKALNGSPSSAYSTVSHSENSRIGMASSASIQNMLTQQTVSPVQQHIGPIGKSDQPNVDPLKTSSGGSEWCRRNTFMGKIHNAGSGKNIGSTKLKQIYVAKSLSTAHATSS